MVSSCLIEVSDASHDSSIVSFYSFKGMEYYEAMWLIGRKSFLSYSLFLTFQSKGKRRGNNEELNHQVVTFKSNESVKHLIDAIHLINNQRKRRKNPLEILNDLFFYTKARVKLTQWAGSSLEIAAVYSIL
jgi:hypothetical protein